MGLRKNNIVARNRHCTVPDQFQTKWNFYSSDRDNRLSCEFDYIQEQPLVLHLRKTSSWPHYHSDDLNAHNG